MKNFYAVIGLLTYATITMAADYKRSFGDTEMCIVLHENDFDDHVLSYLFDNMREEVELILQTTGLVDFKFRKLDQQEYLAEGYGFILDLCGSHEAIAETNYQLKKLAQTIVVTETSMAFSRPKWEFLRIMKDMFVADGGSLKISLIPSVISNEIKIYIVSPRQCKDLAEFVAKNIVENYCDFELNCQEDQLMKFPGYIHKFKKQITNDTVYIVMDKQNKILYFVGLGDACKKWRDKFNNYLNN